MQDDDVLTKTHFITAYYRSRGDNYVADRIAACCKYNRCRQRHCPRCEHSLALTRFNQVNGRYVQLLDQHPRMQVPQILTMTTGDTPIQFIGSTVTELNATTSKVLNSVNTYAWYRQIEVVPAVTGLTHANVHAHAVLFLPQRESITAGQLYSTWAQSLGTNTAVYARDLTLEPPYGELKDALRYTTKAEQPLKMMLFDPETGDFDPSLFSAYSEQTAGKHLHRFERCKAM